MNAIRKTLALAAGVAFALTLGGCGSGDGGGCSSNPTGPGCTVTTTTTLPPPVRTILKSGSCTDIEVNFLCFFESFTTSQRGDLDVTVDWTYPEDAIQVMVSTGTCTLEQINGRTCSFITSDTAATTPKPRVLKVTGVAPGTYQLYVGNRGPKTESVSIQIGLTTVGVASSPGAVASRESVHPYASQVTGH